MIVQQGRQYWMESSPERKISVVLGCLMDVTLSDVYHWQRPKIEETCKQWKLCVEGPVPELREHLT